LEPQPDVTEQGRKMALRVGVAFIILMAVNVGFGLWLIVRHETKNPNRALLETQMRQQIAKSIEHAAATLTPGPLGVSEITVPVATGKLDTVADELIAVASRLGGSATKGLQAGGRISILVDIPSNREQEFRASITAISAATQNGTPSTAREPGSPIPATGEKKSFVVQIVEGQSK